MSILQRIAPYEYEPLCSFYEACIHYFSGLYLGMEVEDLPSEMVSMLHQSERFALWVDCGSVSERMTVESMKEILRLSVQQAKEELLKYCITRDSSYVNRSSSFILRAVITLCTVFREVFDTMESMDTTSFSLLLDFILIQIQSDQPALVEGFVKGPSNVVRRLLRIRSPRILIQFGGVFFQYLSQSPLAKSVFITNESLVELYQLKAVLMNCLQNVDGRSSGD